MKLNIGLYLHKTCINILTYTFTKKFSQKKHKNAFNYYYRFKELWVIFVSFLCCSLFFVLYIYYYKMQY